MTKEKQSRKNIYLLFSLSMPSRNSWNGKWSRDGAKNTLIKKITPTIKNRERIEKILESNGYRYDFGDGWAASIDVQEIDGVQARKERKLSRGFCGYDWMVRSILSCGEIKVP